MAYASTIRLWYYAPTGCVGFGGQACPTQQVICPLWHCPKLFAALSFGKVYAAPAQGAKNAVGAVAVVLGRRGLTQEFSPSLSCHIMSRLNGRPIKKK